MEQGAFFSGWKNRGIQLHRQRNYEDALAAYEQAIRYNPFDDHAYRCLGEMFTELGMYEVALSTYQRAIEQGCASVWAIQATCCSIKDPMTAPWVAAHALEPTSFQIRRSCRRNQEQYLLPMEEPLLALAPNTMKLV